ncbi:hypothetical protein ABPG74_018615 [Tetrahymena malaccensis]
MKEYHIILLISFIFYGINICHIFLIAKLLQQGFIICFSCYVVLFSIDKIITIYVLLKQQGCKPSNMIFILLDFFQVGFIYYFFQELDFSLRGIISTKLFGRVYPLMLFDFVFFFALKIFENDSVSNELINLAYANFVILVAFTGILNYFLINETDLQKAELIYSVLYQSAHSFSISSAMLLKDSFGVNLAIYYLVFILIDTLYFWFQNLDYRSQTFLFSFFNYCMNNFFFANRDKDVVVGIQNLTIQISYLNFLAQLGLIISYYNIDDINLNQNKILNTNIICTCIFILLILIIDYDKFLNAVFRQEIFWISSQRQMEQCLQLLNKRHIFIKQHFIYHNLSYQHDLTGNKNQKCLYYEIQKSISFNHKNGINVQIKENIYFNRCLCSLQLLAIEEEYIDDSALICYDYELLNKINGISIFLSRYSNGFLYSEVTQFLLQKFIKNVKYSQYESEMLQIVSYYKYIKPHMTINPQIILYELIE